MPLALSLHLLEHPLCLAQHCSELLLLTEPSNVLIEFRTKEQLLWRYSYRNPYRNPASPAQNMLGRIKRICFADIVYRAGKVRAVGASNYDAVRLQQALDISREKGIASYAVLQPLYNLMEREKFEGPLQELCLARDIAAVPYFGLASGSLTGKYRSKADLAGKARSGAVEQYMNEHGMGVLSALDKVAAQTSATPAQVALAWLAAQPAVTAPIASATSVKQVHELLGAMRQTLTTEQLAILDAASTKPRPPSR